MDHHILINRIKVRYPHVLSYRALTILLIPGTVWLNNESFVVVSDLPDSSGSPSKVNMDIPEPSQMILDDPVKGKECPQGTSTLFPAYIDTKGETSSTETASKGKLKLNYSLESQ